MSFLSNCCYINAGDSQENIALMDAERPKMRFWKGYIITTRPSLDKLRCCLRVLLGLGACIGLGGLFLVLVAKVADPTLTNPRIKITFNIALGLIGMFALSIFANLFDVKIIKPEEPEEISLQHRTSKSIDV